MNQMVVEPDTPRVACATAGRSSPEESKASSFLTQKVCSVTQKVCSVRFVNVLSVLVIDLGASGTAT